MGDVPKPIPGCMTVPCPKCSKPSPCVDHVEVDTGIGVQTGQHEFHCPTHGGFSWSDHDGSLLWRDFDDGSAQHGA